jgi:hypothetical protein
MITKEQAMTLRHGQELHYTGNGMCKRTIGPRGGVKESITRVRVSGMCKTWKTRPEEFRVPIKYGLYESGELTHQNCELLHLPDECPIAKSQSQPCACDGESKCTEHRIDN